MLLKEYIANLQKFVNDYPECLELCVVYATDDEGNSYENIHYSPTILTTDDEGEYVAFSNKSFNCINKYYKNLRVCIN